MTTPLKRTAKLLAVHAQMKRAHEARRAGFLQAAQAAREEADALVKRFDETDSLSGLFPELYHARITAAWTRAAEQDALAAAEAQRIAALSLRETHLDEELARLRAAHERAATERAALDWVETRLLTHSERA